MFWRVILHQTQSLRWYLICAALLALSLLCNLRDEPLGRLVSMSGVPRLSGYVREPSAALSANVAAAAMGVVLIYYFPTDRPKP